MYFYFGFKYAGLSDPVHVYEQIEVRNVIKDIIINPQCMHAGYSTDFSVCLSD